MYSCLANPKKKPESSVNFKINERLQRICMWMNQNFLLGNEIEFHNEPVLKIYLICLKDNTELRMDFTCSGNVTINTNNLNLASDLIQSLAIFLNLDSLEVYAIFPNEEQNIIQLVEQLSEIEKARVRLYADIADRLSPVRDLIIRAEDSRINSITNNSEYYNELNNVNKERIHSYNIRLSNYNEGVETVKIINSTIQKCFRLRVGKKCSDMVILCRKAIKLKNNTGLIKIMQTGVL